MIGEFVYCCKVPISEEVDLTTLLNDRWFNYSFEGFVSCDKVDVQGDFYGILPKNHMIPTTRIVICKIENNILVTIKPLKYVINGHLIVASILVIQGFLYETGLEYFLIGSFSWLLLIWLLFFFIFESICKRIRKNLLHKANL